MRLSPRAHARALPCAVALVALAAALPRPAEAQSTATAFAAAYQYGDMDPSPGTTTDTFFHLFHPSCVQQQSASSVLVVAARDCWFDNGGPNGTASLVAPGAGTVRVTSAASFDPGIAGFRAASSLGATGFTLSPFVPQYDPVTGERLFTNALRPDVIGAYADVSLNDQMTFSHAPGITPTTMSMFLKIDGTFDVPGLVGASNMILSFAQSFVAFCTGPSGTCSDMDGTNEFTGVATFTVLGSPQGSLVTTAARAPASGGLTPTVAFAGAMTTTPAAIGTHVVVDGVVTLGNVPIAALGGYDFNLVFSSYLQFAHLSHFADPCDPQYVPGCTVGPSDDVTANASIDFSHTVSVAGYQIFDAAGNDVTAGTTLSFASGIVPGAAAVATPEPATLALFGGGLVLLGAAARRRAARRAHAITSTITS